MSHKRLATSSVLSLGLILTTAIVELRADIILIDNSSIQSSDVAQIGSVDIFFVNEGALPIDIALFQLSVTLVGGDDGTILTGFDAPRSGAYIFAGNSDRPLGLVSNGSKTVEVGDFLNSGTKQIPVSGRGGLASLQFSIPANASKSFQLALSLDPQDTFVENGGNQVLPFRFTGGAVSVSAVPEPTASVILTLVPLMNWWIRRRKRCVACTEF